MSQFRSSEYAIKWADLHKKRQELQNIKGLSGKQLQKNEEKIDLLSSVMCSYKKGFMLTEAKIKKSIKFLKEHTGKERVRYGIIPDNLTVNNVLFKDILLIYVEQEGKIIFREHETKNSKLYKL